MTSNIVSPSRLALSLIFVLLGAAGCSDSDDGTGGSTSSGGEAGGSGEAGGDSTASSSNASGGAGGEGGAPPQSVVGTVQDGECETAAAFAEACDAEGGVLGDNCQNAVCGGRGWRATCFEAPPEPGADEFSCEGLFNCAVGEICTASAPPGDGCYAHSCDPVRSECSDDPTCDCLEAAAEDSNESVMGCDEDEDGNITFRPGPF